MEATGERARVRWLVLALLAGAGCRPMSEQVKDASAGMNGGFEHVREGLPSNWYLYTTDTLPSGSYRLLYDREDFKEGEQSLRFLVEECSSAGGSSSPGFFQEYPAVPGATYAIGFWIRSEGCDWSVSAGGVAAKTGGKTVLASSAERSEPWRRIDGRVTVPPEYDRLRFQLSITSPGSLWIDDVSIARVEDPGTGAAPDPADARSEGDSAPARDP